MATIDDASALVASLGLPPGLFTSLDSKLDAARSAVVGGGIASAIGSLEAAQGQVDALWSGGRISDEEAAVLTALLNEAIAVLSGCQAPPAKHLNVVARDGQNTLFWVNPNAAYASTRILFRTDTFPAGPADPAATLLGDFAGVAGAVDSTVHVGLINDTTYYYAAFVDNGVGTFSTERTSWGRPADTSGSFKWAYTVGAGTFPTVGVSWAGYYAASADAVHAMQPKAVGGDWPAGWLPPKLPKATATRPIAIPLRWTTVGGTTKILFHTSEVGRVHAMDAISGAALWTSPFLGTAMKMNVSGMFTDFGGAFNVVFVGTAEADGANRFYGLNLADGSILWAFDNGGGAGAIGPITGAAVDYANTRVYFTSRGHATGSPDTVWSLTFNATSATKLWSAAVPDVGTSPVNRGVALYVGTDAGDVHALDAATGAVLWASPYVTGDGPVDGFVMPDRFSNRLYFSTDSAVHAIADNGGSATAFWSSVPVVDPSPAVLIYGRVYVGSADGRMYSLDAVSPAPVPTFVTVGDPGAPRPVGALTFDIFGPLVLAGTDEGVVYAHVFPF